MRKSVVLVSALALWAAAVPSIAQTLTPAERTFFDQHISDFVKFEPTLLAVPAGQKVFTAPFYEVEVRLAGDTGNMANRVVVARVETHLVNVSVPGTDAEMADLVKAFNPAFRLATAADAAALQQALDAVYPITDRDDQKVKANRRVGSRWLFVRGEFFEDKKGFVFETDAKGVIVAAKYALKLPK